MPSAAYTEYTNLMKRGAFRDAAVLAERRSIEPGENCGFWLTQQSRALMRARQFKKAYTCANRAVHAAPGNSYAQLARADALVKLRKYRDALDDFTGLIHDPKVGIRARKGMLECLAKTKKDWARILSLITEWDMPAEDAFRWRVQALLGLKRFDDAVDACHKRLKQSPDDPAALWQLTDLEVERDGLEQVTARMARMAKIPSRPPIYGEIYASLCKRAGSTDAALDQYTKLSDRDGDTNIIRKRAFALAKSGRETEAIPLMEEILRMNPGDDYINKCYVAACNRIDNSEGAVHFYQELLSHYPCAGNFNRCFIQQE